MPRIRRKVTRTGAKPRKRERKVRKVVELTEEQQARKRAQEELLAQRLRNRVSHTIIPAGVPPYDLEGDDLESIRDWVAKIKSTGNHTVQSCQYWVKYFYDPSDRDQKPQWIDVRKKILDNHKDFGIPNLPYNKSAEEDSSEDSES
tara:strand:+ start:2249 stop:2686 length:438 start_codon:yes stop_codon:yes gene_type:complete